MAHKTSSDELAQFLCQCGSEDVYRLIQLMKSRLSPASRRLVHRFGAIEDLPPSGTPERLEVCTEIVDLLGWYGANTVAYVRRRVFTGAGSKPYLGILRDVVRLLNKRLPRKQRHDIPTAPGVAELEQKVVEILLGLQFHNKSTEEIVQILQESGLEREVAQDVAQRYGPGLAGAGLPLLVRVLGKKTVMTMMQQLIVTIVARFIGKEAATQMAKRLAIKVAQKTLTRLLSYVGWVLLAVDILLFGVSPARRITLKAVLFVSLIRVPGRSQEE